jgi:multidrug resistance efflux pump
VTKGEVVMTLDNPSVDRDLAYARAQARAAELRLRDRGVATSAPSAEGENAAAEILHNKEQKLDRYKKLLATGDVSRQELLDVETEVAAARRDWLAEKERRQTVAPSTDPGMTQAELDRARADQKFAEYRKSLLSIVAPAAGVLHLRMHEGDDVFTRDPVAEVRDATSARVQAQVAPELLRYVRVGQMADVKVMTIPPRSFREPIANVSEAGADGGSAIVVKVPNPDRMMQPGTPAVITLQ